MISADKEFGSSFTRSIPPGLPLAVCDLSQALESLVDREIDAQATNWKANRAAVAEALLADRESLARFIESKAELPQQVARVGEMRQLTNVRLAGEPTVVIPWKWDGTSLQEFGAVVAVEGDAVVAEPPPLSLAALFRISGVHSLSETPEEVPPILRNRAVRLDVTVEGRAARTDGQIVCSYETLQLRGDHEPLFARYLGGK